MSCRVSNFEGKQCTMLCKTAFLLASLIALLYGHTLKSPWQLDDYINIVQNPSVHLTTLDLESIKSSFYGVTSATNRIERPVAYFSFALNWYWGKDRVVGYHLVNITIHFLTSFFLFYAILLLFQTPIGKGVEEKGIYGVALLSASLWAIHPIQIQSVTYIVQRMTTLAALFSIVGICCYIKARLSASISKKVLYFTTCGISFLLGVGSKSNALLLPFSLILIEFTFFHDLRVKRKRRQSLLVFAAGIVIIASAGVVLFMDGKLSSIVSAYSIRPFTLWERLLTQPRVLIYYISQIFYPVASRFSISHDVVTSTSLMTPWTTLPSIVAIIGAGCFAIWNLARFPILGFGILFYLGNHLVESSVIPLEMIFEHRNYLPTLFLFFPISLGIIKFVQFYRLNQKSMFCFLWVSVCVMLVGIGISTYIRNSQWQSIRTLWEDAMKKAPKSARPLQTLAWGYYAGVGKVDTAIRLYKRSLELNFDREYYRSTSYNNLAGIYFSKRNDYEASLHYARKAIVEFPGLTTSNLILCKSLGNLQRYDEAMEHLDNLLSKYPDHVNYQYLKGYFLLRKEKPENALKWFRLCLKRSSNNWLYLREIGLCFNQLHDYRKAFWFLHRADSLNPRQTGVLAAMVENRFRTGNTGSAKMWGKKLIETVGDEYIDGYLRQQISDPMGLPLDYTAIAMVLSENLDDIGRHYLEKVVDLENYYKQDS